MDVRPPANMAKRVEFALGCREALTRRGARLGPENPSIKTIARAARRMTPCGAFDHSSWLDTSQAHTSSWIWHSASVSSSNCRGLGVGTIGRRSSGHAHGDPIYIHHPRLEKSIDEYLEQPMRAS